MSGAPVIETRHLCKEFVVGPRHGSLKRLVAGRKRGADRERNRALDDVCLQIRAGESVALVGKNGSGKSTLLSLIGRIYRQTSGEIVVRGAVAPLLELGAGFHHELTGRENIYLNGVILGLARRDVQERFDAIVDFAGDQVKKYLDDPVRNYSSGMLTRLGFAVACHTHAPILLVDEGLATADEEFQEQCYRRIAGFRQEGRTILFVSHNLDAVRRVARRAVWLDSGRLRLDGTPELVGAAYRPEAHHHETFI
jgi:ABC-type polysaccharide/polyol phosphate transport system ATPase subunit